jgi:hypothetical protein
MNKKVYLVFFLSSIILFSSCASILNGKQQDVILKNKTDNATIYVDNVEKQVNSANEIEVDRDMNPKQVRIEKEGYKDKYDVLVQTKKSPWYIMTVIPFGILIQPLTMDRAPNSWDYPKEYTMGGLQKIPENPEVSNELIVKETSFDVDKNNVVTKLINGNRYHKKGEIKVGESEKSEIDLNAENTIFSKGIYDLLKGSNYIDTTSTVIKNRAKLVNISGNVKKITVYNIFMFKGGHQPGAHFMDISVEWKLQDVYGNDFYSEEIEARSGNFSNYFNEDTSKKTIQDAINTSLVNLLKKKEFVDLMSRPVYKDNSYQALNINEEAAKTPKDLDQAMKASCTIKNEDGHGSGFFVGNSGYILSNYHVVANQDDITVLDDKRVQYNAEIVRISKVRDLALLKIDHQPEYSFSVSGVTNHKRGDNVYAVGTPTSIQLGQSLSKGIISGVRKENDVEYIQVDASVNPGNSGGPLINEKAELVGVVNAKLKGIGLEGLGFAIPQKFIKEVLKIK